MARKKQNKPEVSPTRALFEAARLAAEQAAASDWVTPFVPQLVEYAKSRGYEVPIELRSGIGQYKNRGPMKVGGSGRTNEALLSIAEAMATDPKQSVEARNAASRFMSTVRNVDLFQKAQAIGRKEVTPILSTKDITIPSGVPGMPKSVRIEEVGETQTKSSSGLADIHITDKAGKPLFWRTPDNRLVPIKVNMGDIEPVLQAVKAGGKVYHDVKRGYDPVIPVEEFDPMGVPYTREGGASPSIAVLSNAKKRILGVSKTGAPARGTIVYEGKKGDWVRVHNINQELGQPNLSYWVSPQRRIELQEELNTLLADTKPRVRAKSVSTAEARNITLDLEDSLKAAMGKLDKYGNAPLSRIARDVPTSREYATSGKPKAGERTPLPYRRLPSMIAPTDLPPGDTLVQDPDTGRRMFKERGSETLLTFAEYMQKKQRSKQITPELRHLANLYKDPTLVGNEAFAREAALETLPTKQPKERPTGAQPGNEGDEFEQAAKAQSVAEFKEDLSPRDRRVGGRKETELDRPTDRIVTSRSRLAKDVATLRGKMLQQFRDREIARMAQIPLKGGLSKFQIKAENRRRESEIEAKAQESLSRLYEESGIPSRGFQISAEVQPIVQKVAGVTRSVGEQTRPIVDIGVGGKKALALSSRGANLSEIVETGRGGFGRRGSYVARYGKQAGRRVPYPQERGLAKSDLVRERQFLEAQLGLTSTKSSGGTEARPVEGSASLITSPFASGTKRVGLLESKQMERGREVRSEVMQAFKSQFGPGGMKSASDDKIMMAVYKTAKNLGLPQDQVGSILKGEHERVTEAFKAVAQRTASQKTQARTETPEPMFVTRDEPPASARQIAELVARRAPRAVPQISENPNPLFQLMGLRGPVPRRARNLLRLLSR